MRAQKPLHVPAFGLIKGGRLDGWAYHLLHFEISDDRALLIRARCTPPGWPFPHDIFSLDSTHWMQLRAVPGSRAKRRPVLPLVETAYRLASLEVPDWLRQALAGEMRMTMRAATKRASLTRRQAR